MKEDGKIVEEEKPIQLEKTEEEIEIDEQYAQGKLSNRKWKNLKRKIDAQKHQILQKMS